MSWMGVLIAKRDYLLKNKNELVFKKLALALRPNPY
jgi:hypothetical protein